MKTIAMILGSGLLFLASPIQAKNNSNDAEREIKEKIHIEQEVRGNENKVEVLFSTNEKGEVNFALAKTENDKLKKELEKQFRYLHFDQMKKDAVNSVTLNFKLQ